MSTILPLLHFNDVYRVSSQKVPGTNQTIDVTQFAGLVDSLRDQWPKNANGSGEGLLLFSGDLFSPSIESSVTRGSHMVPIINELSPDVSLTGNHDFDFGYHHLLKLVEACKFPWILSNIKDTDTGGPPKGLTRFQVFERAGLKIGVIGLVEEEWIATVSSWPSNFVYQPMEEVGIELSKLLRDPAGEYQCDLVLALTHARIPNDITLAKQLNAVPGPDSAATHGVDIIFGGHDHMYYIGQGIKQWDGYNFSETVLGAEKDDGLLIVKSGTDFRDLSSLEVEVVDCPEGSVRKKRVQSIKGKRHQITPDMPSSQSLKKIIATLLSGVSDSLKAPVCRTLTEFNCHSEHVRMEESASGNWFADVLRHTYDDALCVKGHGGADGVLICGGTIRGDCSYGPGIITVGDIMEILPFEDPIVVKELDGPTLWAALEGGLGKWPAQEGRFPIISGFRIEWDSRKPPGSRVLSIWTEKLEEIDVSDESNQENTGGKKTILRRVNGDPVSKDDGGKKYYVVTREYMAAGHDGYEVLKDCPYVGGIDDEYGMMMSTIVRKFLLGSQYIKQMKLMSQRTRPDIKPIDSDSKAVQRWKLAGQKIIQSISSKHTGPWICDALKAANTHHMSSIDCYDGNKARDGKGISASKPDQLTDNEKLVVVAPVVDGRLRNVAKAATVSS